MAQLLLTGGRVINVKDETAQKIIEKKKKKMPADHNLDIQGNFIELGRIREVIMGDKEVLLQRKFYEDRQIKINKYEGEAKGEEEEFKMMSPSDKASKMIDTWCWLAYKRAGNKMSFEEWGSSELSAKIFDKVKDYFEKNKVDYCPPSVYIGLIDSKEMIGSI